jgi:hypothetical protein
MTIPAISHPCWTRAVRSGLARIKTDSLAMQFLTQNVERSTDPIAVKAAHIQAFFAKWERTLRSEIDQLARI